MTIISSAPPGSLDRVPCSALRGDKCFNGFWVTMACYGAARKMDDHPCMNEKHCAFHFGSRAPYQILEEIAASKEDQT